MRRPLAVIAVLLVLSGCQGATPTNNPVDPFFGRTRIEPPATGTIAGPKDPGYAPPQTPAPQTPGVQTPNVPASGAVPKSTTLGNSQPSSPRPDARTQAAAPSTDASRGDVVSIPSSARSASNLVASRVSPSSSSPIASSQRETAKAPPAASSPATAVAIAPQKIVQTISPRSKTAEQAGQGSANVLPATWPSPQGATPTQKAVNILDLPAPPATGSQSSSTRSDNGVVLATATEEVADSSGPGGTSAAASTRFGHDPDYQWLRGRLEYSQIDRCWRLRYIPIDGTTDSYGGSVMLTETPKLSGFERGDLVEIRGRLVPPQSGGKTFAAGYEITDIQRLGT